MNKKRLYESIMRNVAREVKKALNEDVIPSLHNIVDDAPMWPRRSAKIGDIIKIIELVDDPEDLRYRGRTGEVKFIDDIGQLHGTWGGLAVNPEIDKYEVIGNSGVEDY